MSLFHSRPGRNILGKYLGERHWPDNPVEGSKGAHGDGERRTTDREGLKLKKGNANICYEHIESYI